MNDKFKRRLCSGEFQFGTHINACDPTLTELLGGCGFDYLCIDTEHTAIDYTGLQMHLIAARAAGCPALVRVPWNEPYLAKRVLEQGPDGIIFPMIRSVEEAKKALDACIYPPDGLRCFGPIRAQGYGSVPLDEYMEQAKNGLCRLLQIEHFDAVNHIDEILELDGLDGVILGPCDLSGSVKLLGQTNAPEVASLIDRTIGKCREHGVPVGVSLGACGPDTVLAWKRRGAQFVSAGSEYGYVLRGAGQLLKGVRAEG